MIVSFYDEKFNALQNNATLIVDNKSYKLVKRPINYNDFSCKCEAFTESIQPTFIVVKDDFGRYIYGSLAGLPILNKDNITEINGADIKSMLDVEIVFTPNASGYATLNDYIEDLFDKWKTEFDYNYTLEFAYNYAINTSGIMAFTDLLPNTAKGVINVYEELSTYLRFYECYIDTKIDLKNKTLKFIIGQTMLIDRAIRLWDYGIRTYGKITSYGVNEVQAFIGEDFTPCTRWILRKDNEITNDVTKRNLYPIKKAVVHYEPQQDETEEDTRRNAETQALTKLCDSLYNENIDIDNYFENVSFETNFLVYVKRGEGLYKNLPVGEIKYDVNGVTGIQIGYRYSSIDFI